MRTDWTLPQDHPFDYQLAMDRLRAFQSPRDKLGHLCESGEVVRVKKGLYLPGWRAGEENPVDPLVLAGLIYGPSYVSLESALSWHGLIPERTEEITSITLKRAKCFDTPVGRFRYSPVNARAYACGVRLEAARGGRFLLAEPEKALCDRIAQVRSLSAIREVEALLEDDLRVDRASLASFRVDLVEEIAGRYRRKNVTVFHRWFVRELGVSRLSLAS
jgi:predicted transcriptional regulator of viral defense system